MSVFDVLCSPWAIIPDVYTDLHRIYADRKSGDGLDYESLSAVLGRDPGNQKEFYEIVNGVAVIALEGVVSKKMNMFSNISGGVSTQMVAESISVALNDSQVSSILLDVDSPGGSVNGLPELADFIYQSRGKKKIVALANDLMASAACWIGSSCLEVYASSEMSQVGSIGIVSTHVDVSDRQKKDGVKTTEVCAGKYKRIASGYEPLSVEGRASIQATVDYMYSVFVDAVARNRGVSVESVLAKMADGKLFIGSQSVEVGLIDGIMTKEDLIKKLSGESGAVTGSLINLTKQKANAMTERGEGEQASTINTVSDLEVAYPELCVDLKGQAAGAERERIQGVLNQSVPGFDNQINALAFDGNTTPGEAAMAVVEHQKKVNKAMNQDISDDAPDPLEDDPTADAAVNPESAGDVSPVELANRAKAKIAEARSLGVELSVVAAMDKVRAEL